MLVLLCPINHGLLQPLFLPQHREAASVTSNACTETWQAPEGKVSRSPLERYLQKMDVICWDH